MKSRMVVQPLGRAVGIAASGLLLLHAPWALAQEDCGYVTRPGHPMAVTVEDLNRFQDSMKKGRTAVFLGLRQEGKAELSEGGLSACILERRETGEVRVRLGDRGRRVWTVPDALERK